MEKTEVIIGGRPMVKIDCDNNHVAIRTGGKELAAIRHTMVNPSDANLYEEVTNEEFEAMKLEQYKSEEYARRLSAAIHERYSVDDEIALAANINAPALLADEAKAESVAAEWAEYQAYREECKVKVRAELASVTAVPKESLPEDESEG